MIDDDKHPVINSPLSQEITKDGKTVSVEIYDDGEGKWVLEVVDEYGNSCLWDDSFKTEQEALNEAIKTIDDDGIESLIGNPSSTSSLEPDVRSAMQMMAPLLDEEQDELSDFLMSDATSDETMMLDTLDGFMTAIVSGPVMLKPSEWLPRVWGLSVRDEPEFETIAQAERITELMMRHLNGIIWGLQHDPDAFEPLFDTVVYPDDLHEYADAEMWAYGYMIAIDLQRQNWNAFFNKPNSTEILRPIYLLGADEVTPEEEALTVTPGQRAELAKELPASIAWIYRFWQPYRRAINERTIATSYQREHPKVGRNDLCPCGSGKKFKRCCGASTVLH